jgi:hypothetical protein
MWQRDTADISGDQAITSDVFPLGDRSMRCEALAHFDGLIFAGHADWRLPNIRELQSLFDYDRKQPAIDVSVFGVESQPYWSSTTLADGSGWPWVAFFFEGGVGAPNPGTGTNRAYVRPVRSGGCLLPETGQTLCYDDSDPPIKLDSCPSAGDFAGQDGFYTTGCPMAGRFPDNGDGTVTDTCTGLMWQEADDGNTRTWCNALDYCENLPLAGFNNWRLPNLRELQSIIDYGNRDPAIDGSFDVTSLVLYAACRLCRCRGPRLDRLVRGGRGRHVVRANDGLRLLCTSRPRTLIFGRATRVRGQTAKLLPLSRKHQKSGCVGVANGPQKGP